MPTLDDYLDGLDDVPPPVGKYAGVWADNNFSSRVDPPVDPVVQPVEPESECNCGDDPVEPPDGGTPPDGGSSGTDPSPLPSDVIPCSVGIAGDYQNKPGTLRAHLSAMTTNMDPALCTIVDAMNWSVRATPLSWGQARPARMFPINLASVDTAGKGGLVSIFDVKTNSPAPIVYITFDSPAVWGQDGPDSLGMVAQFNVMPGTAPYIGIPTHYEGYSDITIAKTFPFTIPLGEYTQVCWARITNTTMTYDPAENFYSGSMQDWYQIHHATTTVEYVYACYDNAGNTLFYEAGSVNHTYPVYYNVGTHNSTVNNMVVNNSNSNNRKVVSLHVEYIRHGWDIKAVAEDPWPDVHPRLTLWPLQTGPAGESECLSDFHSADGTTRWMSEAITPIPNGFNGLEVVGHRLAFDSVGSLVSMKFFPNKEDVLSNTVPHPSTQKQLFFCHSAPPFTGTGMTSGSDPHPPQLSNTPIPNDIALLRTNPTLYGDILVHGAGLAAHAPMPISAANFYNSRVIDDPTNTIHATLKLTFRRVA